MVSFSMTSNDREHFRTVFAHPSQIHDLLSVAKQNLANIRQ